jgi:excisionase family DNA binding protein
MDAHSNGSRFLTVDEVAALTRYAKRTIYRKVRTGAIPYKQHVKGGKLLFDRGEIERWIEHNLTPAA